MIDHYNAFISYRHAEKDIQVARTIQSDLEHFHIPAKIRKETGMKKIDRIFLDKDELGAASDLSEEISNALAHADHLIVICSTAMKESLWVPREIAYFLRNHTRRQITTVLVDGEPEDVIPDILKYEDRVIQDSDGSVHTVRVPLEPLSCDYRLPRKKAKKEELPRLASKLLECSYDELMNRRRAYKVRRLTAVFSLILAAAIAFGAYLLYSRKKIRENYEAALTSQSVYLANESLYSLEQEQRILALQLALEALPKDAEDSRPVLPQAVRAVTESTLAYTTRDGFGIEDVWSYRMSNRIWNEHCDLSPSGKALVAWDSFGNITMWDTSSHAAVLSLNLAGELQNAVFLPEDRLLLLTSKSAKVYQSKDGTLLWEQKPDETFITGSCKPIFTDDSLFLATADLKLHRFSLSDGSETALYQLPETIDGENLIIYEMQLSPDETRIAIRSIQDFSSQMLVYDLTAGTAKSYTTPDYISTYIWGDDKHLILASTSDLFGSNSTMDSATRVKTDHVKLSCLDPGIMFEVWNYDFTSTNVAVQSGFLSLPEQNAVAYFHANKAEILKIKTGSLTASYNTNDPIIMANDPDGDGWPFFVTETGGLAFPGTKDSITVYPYFTGDLNQIFYESSIGFFAHPANSPEILHYGLYVTDTEWQPLASGKELSEPETAWLDDRVLALLSYEPATDYPDTAGNADGKVLVLTIANPSTGAQLYQIPLQDEEEIPSYRVRFLGSRGSHFYLGYVPAAKGYRVLDVDLNTGKTSQIELVRDEIVSSDFCTMEAGKIYYCCKGNADSVQLYAYDTAAGETASYSIGNDQELFSTSQAPIYLPFRNDVLLIGSRGTILVDLNGSPALHLELPSDWTTKHMAADPNRRILALSNNAEIRMFDQDGREVLVITCPTASYGMSFCSGRKKGDPTLLLVACTNGFLYRFNAETGELLGSSDLYSTSSQIEAEFSFDEGQGLLYLQLGDTLNIFEMDSWYRETTILRCLGHHVPSDRFYTYSHPRSKVFTIGYFRHYSLDDLIRKAQDMLQGTEMPKDLKEEYGLEITTEN